MDVAVVAGIIMIVSVVVMLVMGVPIGISIGMSSALWTGYCYLRPEDVHGSEFIFPFGHPLLYPGGQYHE